MNLYTHKCGGTILTATHDGESYDYCDECAAFSYDGDIPEGTDRRANKQAWDDGESSSK